MNTSLKNKNARGQPSSYCQTILFNQAFLLLGQEAANQVCILLWKKRNRERESFAEVLSTQLWSAALKLGQRHLTSLTKNKSCFFFLETVGRKEYRKRKVFPIEYEPECEQFRAFSSSSIGWLISLYDTQWWRQTEKHFQGIKQGCVLHSLTEERAKLERVLLHCM